MDEIKQTFLRVLAGVTRPAENHGAAAHVHPHPSPSWELLWCWGNEGTLLMLTAEVSQSAAGFGQWSTTGATGPVAA